jgi:hypothetical protein
VAESGVGAGVVGRKVPKDGGGERRSRDAEGEGNHGVIVGASGVGVTVGVGVSCSKISRREKVGPGKPATLLEGVSLRGPMKTAIVPPAKIRPARSSTPTARMPGPRLPTRAVSRVRWYMTPPRARSSPGRRCRHRLQSAVPDGLGRPQLRQITSVPQLGWPSAGWKSTEVQEYRPTAPQSRIQPKYLVERPI